MRQEMFDCSLLAIMLALTICLSVPVSAETLTADQTQAIELNNAGVTSLNASNFKVAIEKLEAAVKLDPKYSLARDNLAMAHTDYGISLRADPKKALIQFHEALAWKSNETRRENLNGIIQILGRNPHSFEDRVELGDRAQLSNDLAGAMIEYGAALKIKNDDKVRQKLKKAYSALVAVDGVKNRSTLIELSKL